jgi:hypothetical protein
MALIPPCPPDPCDDRVCLACVTVRDGKIIDICHFSCRHQLVTFETLYYWLSLVGFDQVLLLVKSYIEHLCCGDAKQRGAILGTNLYQRENLTSAVFTNPRMVTQVLSMFVGQKLGSTFVNAMVPNSQTVDLRPLVGREIGSVTTSLNSYNIAPFATVPVDYDLAWTDDAVAAGAQFTPAAFSPIDPLTKNPNHLTMYTKGNSVVGFDMTNPVSVLQKQVVQLQQQVDKLTGGGGGESPVHERTPGRGPTTRKKG